MDKVCTTSVICSENFSIGLAFTTSSQSQILTLNPFIDEDHILRFGENSKEAELAYNNDKIINHIYKTIYHGDNSATLAAVETRFCIYLELVLDLMSHSCIRALHIYIARKFDPKVYYSNNARTFKCISYELELLANHLYGKKIQDLFCTRSIEVHHSCRIYKIEKSLATPLWFPKSSEIVYVMSYQTVPLSE